MNKVLCLLVALIFAGAVHAQEEITNGLVTVKAATGKKGISGFDVYVQGKLLCPVRFGSQESIIAKTVKKDGNILFFGDLSATVGGFTLGKESFVKVEVKPNHPYPEISFNLKMDKFDRGGWESNFGNVPFHFLTLQQENAEIVHHRGWIVATPILDPYPLKEGRQGIVCSKWSRDWMWAPPFGACPIPVVGLWTPKDKKYVAFDFTHSRLTEHSEKYIASSYCWQQGSDKNFVTLVYPFPKNYIDALRYPKGGEVIASHCELIYNLDMPYWKDPNTFYHEYIWSRYKDLLPSSPILNDLSYLPGDFQYRSFPIPGGVGLTYKVPAKDNWESMFFEEGTVIPIGDVYSLFSMDYLYYANAKGQIENVKKQLEYLIGKAKKFTVNGEECVYWEKPLEGKGKAGFAGDMTTLRNIHGWTIAQTMLDIYKHEKAEQYLPYIEGALNWTKYNVCTRNDISDVPEAMFLIGAPGISFCLDYYFTFRDDSARKERAHFALELARALVYRYLAIFPSDTDEDDIIDGTFLIEPNSGQPWTGAACANECGLLPITMLEVYAATGDPILRHYILGMIERWSLLYQEVMAPSIKKYTGKFTECYGLFDECAIGGKGKRAAYGGLYGFPLVTFPVGQSKARVYCGEKAAIVFNKEGMHTDVSEYRCSRGLTDGMSFKIDSKIQEPFDIVVSFPFFDLRDKEVFIKRAGNIKKLEKETDYRTQTRAFWCIYIVGVQNGDVVAIGKLNENLPVLNCSAIKPWNLKPRNFESEGFKIIDISKYCNEIVNFNWDDSLSYAPYLAGEHYARKVPYFLVPPILNQGKPCVSRGELALNLSVPYIFFFVSEVKNDSNLVVNYEDGERESISFTDRYLAWQGWPPIFKCRIDILPYQCKNKKIKSISMDGLYLWAITASTSECAAKSASVIRKMADERKAEQEAIAREEKWKESLKTGYALCLKSNYAQANSYEYTYMYVTDEEQKIPEGSFLEYDIFIPKESAGINGGVDLTGGSVGNIRDKIGAPHPGQKIQDNQKGQWVHRKFDLGEVAGQSFQYAVIGVDGKEHKAGTYIVYYKNICITDGKGKVLIKLYDNGNKIPSGDTGIAANGGVKEMTNYSVEVVPAEKIKW